MCRLEITKEGFIEMTGREPENDDLERCNCAMAGQPGHTQCGVCLVHAKPMFMCSVNACGKKGE